MAKSQRSGRIKGTTLRRKSKGSGVDAFFKANNLTPELAAKILKGQDSIPGHNPNNVRNMRMSLQKFDWTPST